MKKPDTTTILLVIILIAGLSLLLYPSVADWWNSFHQSQAISNYDDALKQLPPEDYTKMFEDAAHYNEELRKLKFPLMDYEDVPGYFDLFNITGDGVMGYIRIPKIGVKLPVYHGTSEGVLQVAVGHLEGTSLPVGGENTHAVFSAHRGLPSAKLFTDLDKIVVGDTFSITVADRTMTYMVDQILVVLPEQVDELYVKEGMDLVTLVTCTPYGINSHRLLVRGVRVDGNALSDQRMTSDAVLMDPLVVAGVLTVVVFAVGGLGVLLCSKLTKRKQR